MTTGNSTTTTSATILEFNFLLSSLLNPLLHELFFKQDKLLNEDLSDWPWQMVRPQQCFL